ncbi:MAG: hypothetical protein M3R11_05110, partial [Acidobacteriota bacterium]|nr:hypothetical protein [Acidobacteriota bacterium]
KDVSQSGQYDIPSFVPPEEIPPTTVIRGQTDNNFPPVTNKIRFEPPFAEDETEDYSDLVRVRDER